MHSCLCPHNGHSGSKPYTGVDGERDSVGLVSSADAAASGRGGVAAGSVSGATDGAVERITTEDDEEPVAGFSSVATITSPADSTREVIAATKSRPLESRPMESSRDAPLLSSTHGMAEGIGSSVRGTSGESASGEAGLTLLKVPSGDRVEPYSMLSIVDNEMLCALLFSAMNLPISSTSLSRTRCIWLTAAPGDVHMVLCRDV